MFEVIKHNIQGVKAGFITYPLAAWSVIYLNSLLVCWSGVNLLVSRGGYCIGIIILSSPLVWLYIKVSKTLKLQLQHTSYTRTSTHHLSAHHLTRIESLLPTNQLDLFHDVLLPSLKILQGILSNIKITQADFSQQQTLFEQKFNEIYEALTRLIAVPELYSTQQCYKTRDLAVTAFTFYRVSYHQLIEILPKDSQVESSEDSHRFLKMIPDKLLLYLGAQSWRSYELLDILYGELSSLKLNADLIAFLKQGCGEALAITTSQPLSSAPEPVEKPVMEASTASSEQTVIVERFIAWMEQKISSDVVKFHPNAGDYIFMDSQHYGYDTVFITHTLLDQYYTAHQITPTKLREALQRAGKPDAFSYCVDKNNKPISLLRIHPITVSRTVSNTFTIKETAHG